ncbi:MAG: hypothetical protein JXR10_05105 [Cyclobacteriaceae bacterium]
MISDELVDKVIEVVNKSTIKNVQLKDDLVDHLSCLIEHEMKRGAKFDEALKTALHQTAPNGLNEIQQETIFLLNYSKIIFMKRLTYILGFIFSAALFVGFFFKLMHLPLAMILMLAGGAGLAFVFIPLLLINRYKQLMGEVLSERLKWFVGSAAIILFVTASLFKVYHLQGAGVLLGLSFITFVFGFLPFLFFRMYKQSVNTI